MSSFKQYIINRGRDEKESGVQYTEDAIVPYNKATSVRLVKIEHTAYTNRSIHIPRSTLIFIIKSEVVITKNTTFHVSHAVHHGQLEQEYTQSKE